MRGALHRKKTIIFLTTVFDNSQNGPAIFANYLWEELKDSNEFDFHIVAPGRRKAHENFHSVGGVTITPKVYKAVQLEALRLAKKLEGDVVLHGNMSQAMTLCCASKYKTIVQINDYEVARAIRDIYSNLRQHGVRRCLSLMFRYYHERKAVRKAARVISNSLFTQSEILRAYGLNADREKFRVIYKGIDCCYFEKPSSLLTSSRSGAIKGPNILFVGTNWRLKGLRELLASIPEVVQVFQNASVTIIGPTSAIDRHEILTLIGKYGIDKVVTLAGRLSREEIRSWYWRSDLLVAPTQKEAFGVALLEAMAAGLPVLASPVGGIPELLDNRITGFLIDRQSSSLASNIIDVLNADNIDVVRKCGIRRSHDFDISHTVRRIVDVYRHV